MARLRPPNSAELSDNLALILVDFDNLTGLLGAGSKNEHSVVLNLVQELRRYLSEELRIKPARVIAYGDFRTTTEDPAAVMAALAASGIETRYVPAGIQANDACQSLTMHATELLHSRPDLAAYVILSGDNWYVPLIQHLQRFGKFVLVASLDLPSSMTGLWSEVSDAFLNARYLLDGNDQDSMARRRQVSDSTGQLAGDPETQVRAPVEVSRIEDAAAYRVLELIEDHFGQYEEVYLTPLLRKMSETLPEEDGEPKDLVNLLQEAGVVWLEKRRGYPFDYTVLMINDEHPDVADVRAADDYPSTDSEDVDKDDHEYEDSQA
ncbi:MAG: hypothetical protein ACI9W4_002932 [Rhodothermales bacterium]|jgi:hypothetical protein